MRVVRKAVPAAAVTVVAVTGVALAVGIGTRTTKSVSATFAADMLKHSSTTMCTGADGAYATTHGEYVGTSTSSDPRLNGTLRLDVKSVLNTTTNLGWLQGSFRIRNAGVGGGADGTVTGVLSKGTLQGFLDGDLHGPNTVTPRPLPAELLGSVTASFSALGGFTAGSLGTGPATNTAIATSGSCPAPGHHHH